MTQQSSSTRFTREQMDQLRRELQARRRALIETEYDIEREGLTDLSEEVTDEISHIRTHAADLGTDEAERDVALELADEELQEIRDIDEALTSMQNQTYGVCQECGCEISYARLEALPFARFCGPCERKFEKSKKEHQHSSAEFRG